MADRLESAPLALKSLVTRLTKASADPQRRLRLLSIGPDRILVEVNGDPYLFLMPGAYIELTPGRISNRVGKWPRFKGKDIKGHIILAAEADLSPTVIASDGANLPPHVAVVGNWGAANQVAAARSDQRMAYLLELAGVPRAEIRRSLRKQPVSVKLRRKSQTLPNSEMPQAVVQQAWVRQPYKGMRLDAYQLDRRLGRGHSAEVWKATVMSQVPGVPLNSGATVAMKIYFPSLLQGFQPIRIQREFTVAADILHDHLARVYDLLISPSRPFHTFMVMEFVDGPTLTDYITASGKLPPRRVARIGLQMFEALTELHSLGAIHRDVKASNIMLSNQTDDHLNIKLVDLGIVAVTADDRLTAASVFLGSKHSAPLEQLTGRELDERTDIYGAGSVLFHCLRGDPMYAGVGPEGAIVQRMISSPIRLTPDISADLDENELTEFVNSCIEVDPKNRPTTARECLEKLKRIETTLISTRSRPGPTR
jgi:serine/threonine protein kinase